MTTTETITDDQICQLKAEASNAGDDAMVEVCDVALHGEDDDRTAAISECVEAIQATEARAEAMVECPDCERDIEVGEKCPCKMHPFDDDRCDFADPGGRSALRAGRRVHPCPTCGEPNRLTAKDIQLGYQCDGCADRAEGFGG